MADTPVSESLEELVEFLHDGVDPSTSPSVAYGIARGDETLLLGAHGLANKNESVAATTKTPYSLASITKPIAATAVAILADRGLVDLDAPINSYLVDSPLVAKAGSTGEATIRNVANHTSGLPLHCQFFYEDEPHRPPAMAETIRRYGKLFDPPGEHYQYSNIGYGILDYIVELMSGRPFAEFAAEEIFAPLGMVNSSIGAMSGEAISYGMDGIGYPRYGFDHPGASAAFSSVEDILKFGRSHLGFGPQILSDNMRVEMQLATAVSHDTWGYGIGWGTNSDLHGEKTVGHTGGMSGVNTILIMLPERDLVVSILVNGQSPLPFRGADNAIGVLVPSFRQRLKIEREVESPAPLAPVAIPPELRKEWHGRIESYEGDLPLTLDITGPNRASASFGGSDFEVAELQMKDGQVQGIFDGQIPASDASKRVHRIHLALRPRNGALNGAAAAITTVEGEGGGAPGNRRGNAVSFWVELT